MRIQELARPPAYVRFRVLEIRGRRVLIVRFGVLHADFRRSFGVHARRLHEALYIARSINASVYFVWYRDAPNQAFHQLSSPDVHVIRSSGTRDALVLVLWYATSPLVAVKRMLHPHLSVRRRRLLTLEKQLFHEAKDARKAGRRVGLKESAQAVSVRLARRVLLWSEPVRNIGKEMVEVMARDPIRVYLRPALEEAARAQATRVGLDPDARIVTLHARESRWRPQEGDSPEWRSCDIATYRLAVDELLRRGFRVVRTGDSTMTPIDWPGVLDLATHPNRSDLLELWCLLHSELFIGCDSGVTELTKLLGVRTLLVNVKHIQSQYPLRRSDRFVVKRLMGANAPHVLSLREQMAAKRREYTLDGPARYIDNSPEELLAAVVEMVESEGDEVPESPAQAEFHRLATMAIADDGTERSKYIGDGRIARFFAERYLEHGDPLTASNETQDRVP